jgi:hypothetical protein
VAVVTSPERIVRALAAADPRPSGGEWWDRCALCEAANSSGDTEDHKPDCPWRLAVEWVAAQDGRATVDPEPCDYCQEKGREWTPECEANKSGDYGHDDSRARADESMRLAEIHAAAFDEGQRRGQ